MSLKNRLIAIICVLVFLLGEIYIGFTGDETEAAREAVFNSRKETIRIWYTDEALTDYINSAALNFYEDNDIRVVPVLATGSEYLESINKASISAAEMPDLYIIGNDSLGKAYLSGLATEISDESGIVSDTRYSKAAQDAVTYENRYVAYPFYGETSYLLYNKTYLRQIAEQVARAELEEQGLLAPESEETTDDAESAEETTAEGETTEAVEETVDPALVTLTEEKLQGLLPSTIEDILNFADQYDAPENVEAIFKWDVSDIFYNYFFIGAYATVGGDCGDDASNIDIYNESAIECLETYQELSEFFSIDADTVSYSSVIQEFLEGKLIFTVATTDAIATVENAITAGDFAFEYDVLQIPDINDTLATRSLSTTNVVAINGYSEHKEAANEFARYLVFNDVDTLYSRTGKVPARTGVAYPYPALNTIMEEYASSASLPKLMEASNYWVELELTFTKAWLGDDANQLLKTLSEQIMEQIAGEVYTEEYIVIDRKAHV